MKPNQIIFDEHKNLATTIELMTQRFQAQLFSHTRNCRERMKIKTPPR